MSLDNIEFLLESIISVIRTYKNKYNYKPETMENTVCQCETAKCQY